LKVFSGSANPDLAQAIAQYLGVTLGDATVTCHNDGETRVQIHENVRGSDVFIIQPTCQPVNDHLMELLIMMDALRRASVQRITAVIAYYGYGRQDRIVKGREPITAKLVADLLVSAGPHRILSLDLHASQIQGFFNIPVDNLHPDPVILNYLRETLDPVIRSGNLVIVALSSGGARRARRVARKLNCTFAFIDEREQEGSYEVLHVVGDITEYAVLVNDMIDTAVSICKAATAISEKGAKHIYACATHGLLTCNAEERIEASPLKEIAITNSIPHKNIKSKKIKILSVAPLLAETIRRIHNEESVSSLFLS